MLLNKNKILFDFFQCTFKNDIREYVYENPLSHPPRELLYAIDSCNLTISNDLIW